MAVQKESWIGNVIYDGFLWVFTIVVDLFFREIHPRSSYRIPKTGPVIFVAAPHANQFVDPLILMRTVRQDAKRRIAFLIAEKSMRRRFVGLLAGAVGSVSVGRALDSMKPAKGSIYLPDPDGDPTLVKGVDTNFHDPQYMLRGLLVLPSVNNAAANAEIQGILAPDEIRLKKPFKGDVAYKQLTGKEVSGSNGHLTNGDVKEKAGLDYEGTSFRVAPHVDQGAVYDSVFKRIIHGGCIGIFPEGGSHDRTELLPFKPGLAIMALGALAEDPKCGVRIVPVGMNYFHPHKFRSRAVIEFGRPIEVPPQLVEQYRRGERREATGILLDEVQKGVEAVTTLAPDYDTLMLIQAVRRLYNPKGKELPLSMAVELNRRLMKGYQIYKDDPRVVDLRKSVLAYNKQLFQLAIRDHQIGIGKRPWYHIVLLLLWRVIKMGFLSIAFIPGTLLFFPIFVLGKWISIRKSKEALAASTVKVRARDVIATWKILVTLALTPILDIVYTSILTWWTYYNRVGGRVPEWIPLLYIAIGGLFFFPALCFMALRFGEIGMDIFKSLRPLVLSLMPSSSNTMVRLGEWREDLTRRINDLIDELGPEVFPDFDVKRIIQDANHPLHSPDRSRPGTPTHRRDGSEIDALSFMPATPPSTQRHQTSTIDGLPRNDSFKNIGSLGLFSSRPGTPNRSRSRTNSGSESFGFGGRLQAFTSLGKPPQPKAKPDLDEVSRNLHAAMRERGRRRKSAGQEDWELDRSDGGVTPNTEMEMEDGQGEEGKKVV